MQQKNFNIQSLKYFLYSIICKEYAMPLIYVIQYVAMDAYI